MNINVKRNVTLTIIGTVNLAQLEEIKGIADFEATTDEQPEETIIQYDMIEGCYLIHYHIREDGNHLVVKVIKS